MTDREMLELAARAAGIEYGIDRIDSGLSITGADGRHIYFPKWNPLDDDGDVLRLAVSVGIDINFNDQIGSRVAANGLAEKFVDHVSATAATRRAIVRAAAEIGKAMGDA